jgi:hypothetical protein
MYRKLKGGVGAAELQQHVQRVVKSKHAVAISENSVITEWQIDQEALHTRLKPGLSLTLCFALTAHLCLSIDRPYIRLIRVIAKHKNL